MAVGKKTGGRKKGTPNKLTATVKDSILAAFDEVGGSAYLAKTAETHPAAFLTLLGKVLPIQAEISGLHGGPLQTVSMTAQEFAEVAKGIAADV
jgi:hypothetical protein